MAMAIYASYARDRAMPQWPPGLNPSCQPKHRWPGSAKKERLRTLGPSWPTASA